MRIVQLANFHSPVSGGIRTTLRAWRAGYRAQGHDVHLVVPGLVTRTRREHGGATHELAARAIPGGGGYRVIGRWPGGRPPGRFGARRGRGLSDRTTLMRAGQWASGRSTRASLVLHERLDHQLKAFLPGWLPQRRMVDVWNRRAVDSFDHLIATSRYGAREMCRIGATGVRSVPLGVDLMVFTPQPRLSPTGVSKIVYLGRLSADKRPDLAVAALEVLLGWGHEVELVFIGDGPMKRELKAMAAGSPVSFSGFLADRTEVARALALADVSIVPCPGETFGLAALESLACGTPVVVAANSGAAELVEGGGGLAVPPGPRGFARAVEEIMAKPERERRLEARKVAEGYPWAKSIEGMLGIYEGEPVPARLR